ncbi:MAG: C25 family peptidase propeptide domain-containing protein, partial [Candidatus Thorarchaeota archaeon]
MERIQCTVFALASAMALCMPLVTFASDEGLPEDLRTRTISFHLDRSILQFSKIDGYDSIQIEGLKSFTNPGEPLLPVRSYTLSFEEGSEIISIRETGIEHWNLSETFRILPTPTPPMWKDSFGRDIEPDETIYNSEEVFPGKHFTYDIGRDGNYVHLFLRVYPVQYVPKLEEVSIITDLTIEIQYRAGRSGDSFLQDFNSECVIITPNEFYWQARDLAQIHESTVGVSTTVVNTTWIDSNYNEAEDPPFLGYSDNLLPGWSSVINYDYSLAKKMTAFLNDTSEHPNLSFVLL